YNSIEKNNWGIAIQAVLDKEPTCRAVFASATPINNSPTEIIDLLNLLLPAEQRVNKDMFFVGEELKPHAIDKIAELSKGRTSFLRDANPKYYPTMTILGEKIKSIPYLKFIRCQMSDFQYNTYKQVYTGTLSQDSQYLSDFVLENPNGSIGLYQTHQIKTEIANADTKWKESVGLDFVDGKVVGSALQYKKLKKYSTKYTKMLDEIFDVIRNDNGKIFIYHNAVHISGVLFIEQVLLENGFIDEFTSSTDNTICMICGRPRKEHSSESIHGYNNVNGGVDNAIDSNIIDNGIYTDKFEIDIDKNKQVDKLKAVLTTDDLFNTFDKPKPDTLVNIISDYDIKIDKHSHNNEIKTDSADEYIIDASKLKDINQIPRKIVPDSKLVSCNNDRKFIWMRNGRNLLTINRSKNGDFIILAGSIHNKILEAASYVMRELYSILSEFDELIVQVPAYAFKLGQYLITNGFKIYKSN
ncbi:hypothetical protein EBX93_16550, partial [bacterium]|nr:hypothetical protein [bacterium]